MRRGRPNRRMAPPQAASTSKALDRTSTSVSRAAHGGGRLRVSRRAPCTPASASVHARRPFDHREDARDTGPPEPRSCGYCVAELYNRFRPHQGLTGRTPDEAYFNRAPAIEKPRWDPRPKWPRASGCAAPYVPVKGECGTRLELEVRHLEGRKHLPIFGLRKAA